MGIEADKAYAAGLIDGEGTILITHYKPWRNRHEGYRLVVELGMCDSVAPMWLQLRFGGRLKQYSRPKTTMRPVYRWNLTDSKAAAFLTAIMPYLKTKRAQAEIAVEYQAMKVSNRFQFTYRKPDVFLEAEAVLAMRVKSLNHGV